MFENIIVRDIFFAGVILISAIVIAWLIHYVSRFIKRKIRSEKPNNSLALTLDSITRPIILLIVVEGVILALISTKSLEPLRAELEKAAVGTIIVIATHGLARLLGAFLTWQVTKIGEHTKKPADLSAAMFLKRIVQIVVYAVGLLLLLDYLGFSIGPLIASLGIGGLAVALALQPTLSNFFAGTQVVSDNLARVGDFIELDEKTRGYVIEIGWRSTKIRTPFNNVIIIPNSVIANSQVTNYNMPNTAVGIIVYCGVSYDSDLARVKEVALEVAYEIAESLDEAVKNFEPGVGFDNFGDSNIVFWVWMQAKDRLSSFNLKSELIARLHDRFRKENITINYPVRMNYLRWAGEDKPVITEKKP